MIVDELAGDVDRFRPEIVLRCYHEEVVEICRRKSASSSAKRGIFFSSRYSDSNQRPLDFCTGYLATVPYEKGSRRCWYDRRISLYTVRYLNIQWYLVSTLVTADDFVRLHPPRASKELKKHVAHEGEFCR